MILARYLTTRLGGPFFFGLSLFSGVLLLDKLFDILDLLINKGVAFLVSVRILVLFLPTVLSLSVPMSLLLACLLVFGRLSEDNEITALRASGLSFAQILWPPLVWAAALCALLLPFNMTWAPRCVAAFRTLYFDIARQDPLVKIEPGQFIPMKNLRLFAERVDRDRNEMEKVWIYRRLDGRTQRIFARRGSIQTDGRLLTLLLRDGQIERFSRERPRDMIHIRFQDYTLQVPLGDASDDRNQSWREKTMRELTEELRRRKRENIPDADVRTEYHLRFAISFAPLALSLLGIPLGMTLERGGRGVGFGASVAVLFGYYLLLVMGINLAQRDACPALPALWIANATALALGAALYYRRLHR